MSQVEISEAAADLRGLIERARAGEEVVLVDHGLERARLVPITPSDALPSEPRKLGRLEGLYKIPDDFDAPLPDDLLNLFYDGPLFSDGPPLRLPEAGSKPSGEGRE